MRWRLALYVKRVTLYLIIVFSVILPNAIHAEDGPLPSSDESDIESQFLPDITESEEEQLEVGEINKQLAAEELHKTGHYWTAPDFSKQETALGWNPHAFDVPPGFRKRVNFWIDVYTKYTTHQAILHDAQYLDLIYKVVDFTDLDNNSDLNPYERERQKKKRIKEEKKKIQEQLLRVQKYHDDPESLSQDDLEIYKKFRFVVEKNKFKAAADRHRLRMQLGQRDRFLLGLFFSGRYIRQMEKIFREENVPSEITRLPFVESSFNLYAYSRVGASGIWQFMRSTGRLYRLKIDSLIDLRNDPLSATRAAARLMRFNYQLLGSWPLALTAYNHGPQGVASIVKKLKTTEINEIVWNTTRKRFGFASENFYAEFLAALEVESHASKYFGRVEISPLLEYDEIELPRNAAFGEIAMAMKENESADPFEKARLYNPFLSRSVTGGARLVPKGFVVRVPKQKEKFLERFNSLDPTKAKIVLQNGLYKVLPGDTLLSISHDFGITLREILEVNHLSARSILRPGQKLVIPTLEKMSNK